MFHCIIFSLCCLADKVILIVFVVKVLLTAGKYKEVVDKVLEIWDLWLDSQKRFDYNTLMLISEKRSIEDLIVETLALKPYLEGPYLVSEIGKARPKTTKQAVYIALSALISDEIVAKVGTRYFLSRVWVQKLNKLLGGGAKRDMIFDLKDGESVAYNFPSLLVCDNYWAHVVGILTDHMQPKDALFAWLPHYWFIIGREGVERSILEHMELRGVRAFFSVKGDSGLDKSFRDKWRGENISINTGDKTSFRDNYYLEVFGDLIVEVTLAKGLATEIEDFYKKQESLTPESKNYFKSLITKKGKVRMKITRDKAKASTARKKLAKDFFVPKSVNV